MGVIIAKGRDSLTGVLCVAVRLDDTQIAVLMRTAVTTKVVSRPQVHCFFCGFIDKILPACDRNSSNLPKVSSGDEGFVSPTV